MYADHYSLAVLIQQLLCLCEWTTDWLVWSNPNQSNLQLYFFLWNMWVFSAWTIYWSGQPVWPNLATFRLFGNVLLILVKWFRAYSMFGIFLSLLWQNCNVFGPPLNDVKGQILKYNLAIWSHRVVCTIYDDTWRGFFSPPGILQSGKEQLSRNSVCLSSTCPIKRVIRE